MFYHEHQRIASLYTTVQLSSECHKQDAVWQTHRNTLLASSTTSAIDSLK